MQTCWTSGSLRLGISNGFVGPPCWWRFIYRSFSARGGFCSSEGCLSQWDMGSLPWRACPAIGIICYLEGLLARGGITHCILLALLPSTPDGGECRNARETVSTWCLASQDWILSGKINILSYELLFKQSWHPVSPAAYNVSSLKIPEELYSWFSWDCGSSALTFVPQGVLKRLKNRSWRDKDAVLLILCLISQELLSLLSQLCSAFAFSCAVGGERKQRLYLKCELWWSSEQTPTPWTQALNWFIHICIMSYQRPG